MGTPDFDLGGTSPHLHDKPRYGSYAVDGSMLHSCKTGLQAGTVGVCSSASNEVLLRLLMMDWTSANTARHCDVCSASSGMTDLNKYGRDKATKRHGFFSERSWLCGLVASNGAFRRILAFVSPSFLPLAGTWPANSPLHNPLNRANHTYTGNSSAPHPQVQIGQEVSCKPADRRRRRSSR